MATYCFSSNRIICVSLAICLSTWASPSEVDPRTFDERVEEGTAAVERGDWERAYEIALPYAEAGNIEAQWMVGLLLGRRGRRRLSRAVEGRAPVGGVSMDSDCGETRA